MSKLPRHIAIVMDGNGRWAQQQQLPRMTGHHAGQKAARKIAEICAKKGIEALTLFAFSSENWKRPKEEVDFLFELFSVLLVDEVDHLKQQNIQLKVIGDASNFTPELREKIRQAEALTQSHQGLKLILAVGYGGRWDIIQATRSLAEQVKQGVLKPAEISVESFQSQLCIAELPEPDLFIRTGGEKRISNFLLWQLAYTELFFTDVLWPDFDEAYLEEALAFFGSRQRRFGHTAEQLEGNDTLA